MSLENCVLVRIGWFELGFSKSGKFHIDRFVRWVQAFSSIDKVFNFMKTNKTFIPLVILLATFVVTGDANNFVFASPDYDRMNI